jgi:hypothetical protein
MTTQRKETIVFTGACTSSAKINTLRLRLDKLQRKAETESDDREKAIRFDLDRAGIERREAEAAELVELRAKVCRLEVRINRYRNVITQLVRAIEESDSVAGATARIRNLSPKKDPSK